MSKESDEMPNTRADLEDVLPLLKRTVNEGKDRAYDIASGTDVIDRHIVDHLQGEFGFEPAQILDRLLGIIKLRCVENRADVTH